MIRCISYGLGDTQFFIFIITNQVIDGHGFNSLTVNKPRQSSCSSVSGNYFATAGPARGTWISYQVSSGSESESDAMLDTHTPVPFGTKPYGGAKPSFLWMVYSKVYYHRIPAMPFGRRCILPCWLTSPYLFPSSHRAVQRRKCHFFARFSTC
jgi:hypothetical protein